jgi:8-oxo-dGTP pyrophosphatase MutT (NUDIX family)
MAHIHTEPGQHDRTASAYIVLGNSEEPRLWFHMHRKLGQWLQFGGHVELNETPWQTVIHELAEESGYDIQQLQLLQPTVRIPKLTGAKSHPLPVNENTHQFMASDTLHWHTDTAYAFITTEQPLHQPQLGESVTMEPMSAAEIRALPTGEIPESVREIGLFILETVLPNFDRVATTVYEV